MDTAWPPSPCGTSPAWPTVDALLDAVEHNGFILDEAVQCFTAIGPAAHDALPLLNRILADPRRHGKHIDGLPVASDLALQACQGAVESISPNAEQLQP